MLRLRVTPAEGDPFERRIETGPLIVGRSSSSGLVISDPFLSRRQARLVGDEDSWKIEDLDSRNGTWVDGRRIEKPTPLRPGSVITFSQSRITVLDADGAELLTDREDRDSDFDREVGSKPWVTVLKPAAEVLAEALPEATVAETEAGARIGSPVTEELVHEIGTLRRRAERLRLLTEVHRALGRSIALDELLQLILDRVFDLLRPEEGVIFLSDPEGRLEPAAQRSASQHTSGQLVQPLDSEALDDTVLRSRTLEREVVDKGLAALALDTQQDDRFATSESLLDFGVRSFLAAPLRAEEGEALGMIVLTSGRREGIYTEEDLSLLVSLASVAALRLQNVELARDAFERRRLEKELALARRIQVALHADSLPEIPGWDLHAGNRPSQGVSGDMYQVLERRRPQGGEDRGGEDRGGEDPGADEAGGRDGDAANELFLMVADVAGKGISASILTATLEALAAGPIERGLPPEEIASWLSRQLRQRTPLERYATLFLAALDPATGALRWVNAGHPPALLLRGCDGAGIGGSETGSDAVTEPEVDHLDACGPPVGLLSHDDYEAGETVLGPGDLLVLYTDGLTEAANPDGRDLAVEGLEAICCRHAGSPTAELAAILDREVEGFTLGVPPEDDRTLVLVRRLP